MPRLHNIDANSNYGTSFTKLNRSTNHVADHKKQTTIQQKIKPIDETDQRQYY
jgi:hypothetical protein